jgi:hypothetical protein
MTTGDQPEPTDADVVRAAATAAEEHVFSRLQRSDVDDLDVTVTFEDRILEVDVYVNAPAAEADIDRIADDAALAGRAAVDELLE